MTWVQQGHALLQALAIVVVIYLLIRLFRVVIPKAMGQRRERKQIAKFVFTLDHQLLLTIAPIDDENYPYHREFIIRAISCFYNEAYTNPIWGNRAPDKEFMGAFRKIVFQADYNPPTEQKYHTRFREEFCKAIETVYSQTKNDPETHRSNRWFALMVYANIGKWSGDSSDKN